MAKNVVTDWSTTAANNTDVGGIGIQGTNTISNFDNATREIMKQIAVFITSATFTSVDINGGTIDATVIGGSTPAGAAFTSLSASGSFALTGDQVQISEGGTGANTAGGARTALGLGTISTQDASAVAITGGNINATVIGGTTPAAIAATSLSASGAFVLSGDQVQISEGGTGATTAALARTALGLAIGTNVQAWDTDLDTWATKTAPSGVVVGTTDTQTLTGKTLTSPTINGGTVNSATAGSFAGASGSNTGVVFVLANSGASTDFSFTVHKDSPATGANIVFGTRRGNTLATSVFGDGYRSTYDGTAALPAFALGSSADAGFWVPASNQIGVSVAGVEVERLTSTSHNFGKAAGDFTNAGTTIFTTGGSRGLIQANASATTVLQVNRLVSDGTIVEIMQDGTTEGTIAVSGTTVSFNAFSGGHYSQLVDHSTPELYRGTIVETVDEMCDWHGLEWLDHEGNTRRLEVGDSAGRKLGEVVRHSYEYEVLDQVVIPEEVEDFEEQAFEEIEVDEPTVELKDGTAILSSRKVRQRVPLFDEVPLFHRNRQPVMEGPRTDRVQRTAKLPRIEKKRRIVREASEHFVPRLVTVTVEAKVVRLENEQLAKFKVSDTPGSTRPYGVFMSWEDDTATVTSLGAFIVRVAKGETVEGGDLIESNGDGCGRVIRDESMSALQLRKRHVATITAAIPSAIYPDGSVAYPATIHCG